MKNYFFVFSVCLACWIANASSLRCYECDTWTSPECNDPFDTSKSVTSFCGDRSSQTLGERLAQVARLNSSIVRVEDSGAARGDPAIVCVKTDLEYPNGDMITWRSCNYLGDETCKSMADTAVVMGMKSKFCEICTKDGCNGAGYLQVAPLLFAVVGVILTTCS